MVSQIMIKYCNNYNDVLVVGLNAKQIVRDDVYVS